MLYNAEGQLIPTTNLQVRHNIPGAVAGRHAWQWQDLLASLTPSSLRCILQGVAAGLSMETYLEIAEQLEERDLHYRSVLQQRRLAVAAAPIEVVVPAGCSCQASDIECLIEAPSWHAMMMDLLDALGKGFAVVEVIWHSDRSGWSPAHYERVDPRHLVFDSQNGRTIRLRGESETDEDLPTGKFIQHFHRSKCGLPARGGLAYAVATISLLKSAAIRDWWSYAEIYGLPTRIGRYGPNASEQDIQTLAEAVAALASDAGAVIPESMHIDIQQLSGVKGGGELFENMVRWCDEQISKAVLGVTLTADAGASLAQARVHQEIRRDLLAEDQRQLLASLSEQIVRWYVDLRWGAQERYPFLTTRAV